jgi:hypothetical protein
MQILQRRQAAPIDHLSRNFMPRSRALPGYRAMQLLRLTLMSAALCLSNVRFDILEKNELPQEATTTSPTTSSNPKISLQIGVLAG